MSAACGLRLIEADPHELGRALEPFARLTARSPVARYQDAIVTQGFCEPIRCFDDDGRLEVIEGFEWLDAMRRLGRSSVPVLVLPVDRSGAIAARLRATRRVPRASRLEEGALVAELRRAGNDLEEQATLCGRTPRSCETRLALWTRLDPRVVADLRAGHLRPEAACRLGELPRVQQVELATAAARDRLTVPEIDRVVAQLRDAAEPERELLLTRPREAIARHRAADAPRPDRRLADDARRLGGALERAAVEIERAHESLASWAARSHTERALLAPLITRTQASARALVRRLAFIDVGPSPGEAADEADEGARIGIRATLVSTEVNTP